MLLAKRLNLIITFYSINFLASWNFYSIKCFILHHFQNQHVVCTIKLALAIFQQMRKNEEKTKLEKSFEKNICVQNICVIFLVTFIIKKYFKNFMNFIANILYKQKNYKITIKLIYVKISIILKDSKLLIDCYFHFYLLFYNLSLVILKLTYFTLFL